MQVVATILICLTTNFNIVSTNYSIFYHENRSEIAKNITEYASNVISAHSDFEATFHFDTVNLDLLEEILLQLNNKTDTSTSLILYNQTKPRGILFKRPAVRKLIHVVILKNLEKFELFLKRTQSINVNDEVLFIVKANETQNLDFLTNSTNLVMFGKILIIKANFKNVTINSVCYFCAENSQKVIELPIKLKYSIFKKLFAKKSFNNLNSHSFQVGYVEYFPFIWYEEGNGKNGTIGTNSTLKGIDYELINVMSQKLNFKFCLHNYANFTRMLRDLSTRKLDFVIGGVTATPQRLLTSAMTRPFKFEGYHHLYVLSKSLKEELIRVFDPFEGYLWLLVVVSILVTSAVLYALDRTQVSSISCLDSFWVCLYMAVEQNVNIKQNFKIRLGPSFLILAWILVCFNVSTAYKSKLSAIVMNPPYKEPNNLDDLISSGYKFVINKEYQDVFIEMLDNSSDHSVKTAEKLTTVKDGFCKMFAYAVENHAAILDEYTALQFDLRRKCTKEIERKRSKIENKFGTNIRITKNPLSSVGQVWLLEKGAIYRLAFDEIISKILEAGLISVWTTKFSFHMGNGSFPKSHSQNYKTARFYSPISIQLLLSLFFIYTIGNCCSIIVFLFELYFYKKNRLKLQVSD